MSKAKVKLYFAYVTAWATQDGKAHFRRDLYNRDGVGVTATADWSRLAQGSAEFDGRGCGSRPICFAGCLARGGGLSEEIPAKERVIFSGP